MEHGLRVGHKRVARLMKAAGRSGVRRGVYNRQRRHPTLGILSPTAYEQLRLSPLGS
jgi:transposase InsO family protein